MSKKTTKRAMLASVVALALCFTMLIGTTYAWFTDSVTSANNIIKSGTLNIDLLVKGGNTGFTDYTSVKSNNTPIFDYDKWEPGYTVVANAKVVTTGNLALKYTMKIVADGAVSDLANVIDVYYAPEAVDVADRNLAGLTRIGTLADAISGTIVINDTLIPGTNTEDFATLALHMQETAGNEYQDKDIGGTFSLQILATQYTYESDSFGIDYDALADETPDNAGFFPTEVANATDLAAALADPDVSRITLTSDIAVTDWINLSGTTTKKIDLGGNKLDADFYAYGSSNLTIDNGEVDGAVYVDGDAKLTVGKDAKIDNQYAIVLYNNAAAAKIDVYGELNGNLFVMGNITDSASVINIYGTIDGDLGGTDIGLALNGDATVNVYDGAVIRGETAIEVRAGDLNVYGGTITATGDFNIVPNGSGTTSTGVGVAIVQHTTALPINVNIQGGTITGGNNGGYAIYENNIQGNDPYANVTINYSGATLNGDVSLLPRP